MPNFGAIVPRFGALRLPEKRHFQFEINALPAFAQRNGRLARPAIPNIGEISARGKRARCQHGAQAALSSRFLNVVDARPQSPGLSGKRPGNIAQG
jgi:hypothetical protein